MTLFESLYRSFEQSGRVDGTARRGATEIAPRRHAAHDAAAAEGTLSEVRRTALARLCAAGFVAYCSYSICRAPLLPLFARELGAGPSLVGLVMGASTLTGVFLKLPAGALSDLFGRRRLLLAGAHRLRVVAVHVSGRLDGRRADRAARSSTAARRPSSDRSHRQAFRTSRRRSPRRVAERLFDGARYRPGDGARRRRLPDCGGRFDWAFIVSGLIGLGVPLDRRALAGCRAAAPQPGRRGMNSRAAYVKSPAIGSCS